jgi:copper chaperone CopZ
MPLAGQRSGVILSIGGMSCANCVASVDRSLRALKGVRNVHIDLAAGKAKVEMTPGAVTPSDLHRAVERAGYTVENLGEM